MGKHLV